VPADRALVIDPQFDLPTRETLFLARQGAARRAKDASKLCGRNRTDMYRLVSRYGLDPPVISKTLFDIFETPSFGKMSSLPWQLLILNFIRGSVGCDSRLYAPAANACRSTSAACALLNPLKATIAGI
jgi:hypothetical protein